MLVFEWSICCSQHVNTSSNSLKKNQGRSASLQVFCDVIMIGKLAIASPMSYVALTSQVHTSRSDEMDAPGLAREAYQMLIVFVCG